MISKEQFIKDFCEMLATNTNVEMEMDLLDIDEWDSFSAMSFLSMIDEKYGVKATPFSIAEAICVEDLYDLVRMNPQDNGD